MNGGPRARPLRWTGCSLVRWRGSFGCGAASTASSDTGGVPAGSLGASQLRGGSMPRPGGASAPVRVGGWPAARAVTSVVVSGCERGDVGIRFGGSEHHRPGHLVVVFSSHPAPRGGEAREGPQRFGAVGPLSGLASVGLGAGDEGNGRKATAAVTRCGCRRGEDFGGCETRCGNRGPVARNLCLLREVQDSGASQH